MTESLAIALTMDERTAAQLRADEQITTMLDAYVIDGKETADVVNADMRTAIGRIAKLKEITKLGDTDPINSKQRLETYLAGAFGDRKSSSLAGLRQIEKMFELATQSKCTCYSNPDGTCLFCGRWEKATKGVARLLLTYKNKIVESCRGEQ